MLHGLLPRYEHLFCLSKSVVYLITRARDAEVVFWCYFIDVLSGFVSNFKFKSDSRSPEIFVILLGFFNN